MTRQFIDTSAGIVAVLAESDADTRAELPGRLSPDFEYRGTPLDQLAGEIAALDAQLATLDVPTAERAEIDAADRRAADAAAGADALDQLADHAELIAGAIARSS